MNIGHIIIGNVKFPLIESHAEILEVLTRSESDFSSRSQ